MKQSVTAKIKSFQDVWKKDKSLLKTGEPSIQVDWERKLPSNEDAYAILIAKGERWRNPNEPFQLNESSLNKILDWLVIELRRIWGSELKEKPDIEILSPSRYLPRINELERSVNAEFGNGSLCRSPPTMFLSPRHGKLLIPQVFLVRVPKGPDTDVTSDKFDTLELAWDKPFFEQVLCEELSHVFFRQLRWEWGSDYVSSMKRMGGDVESNIRVLNEVIAQYSKEIIAQQEMAQWLLYVVGDKISVVWQNRQGMENYRAVDALSRTHNLSQIAMIDDLSIPSEGNDLLINAELNPHHPHYSGKLRRFEKK